MAARGRFMQCFCQQKTAKNRVCGTYMGDIQIDLANTTRKYCRPCKRLEEWSVDDDGRITVKEIPQTVRLKYFEPAAVIRGN